MTKLRVVSRDRGYNQLLRTAAAAARGARITVGIHAAQGNEAHTGIVPVTVIDVALWNEFGTARIPARPFIRGWYDANLTKNRQFIGSVLARTLGSLPLDQGLEIIGQRFVGDVQRNMAAGVPPPNAPKTIARKGSSKPLIDTGQLRQSITYVVRLR